MANLFTNRIFNVDENNIITLYPTTSELTASSNLNIRRVIDSIIITNTSIGGIYTPNINLFIERNNISYYLTYQESVNSPVIFNKPITLVASDQLKAQVLNAKTYGSTDSITATVSIYLSILEIQ
jgi:hypothetical protein